jgi:hypothetical protein
MYSHNSTDPTDPTSETGATSRGVLGGWGVNHNFVKGGRGVVGEIRGENVWKNLVKLGVKISRNF